MKTQKNQHQLFYESSSRIGQRDELFLELVRNNDITEEELISLIKKRPEHYSRYKGFVGKLKELGETDSHSTRTCVSKEAAKMLAEKHTVDYVESQD